jgi:hypothetical protein
MINANELRLGNYHLYHFIDKYDERKEWDEIYTIAPSDIQMLADKIDMDYSPVPLTKEWLLKASFRENKGVCYLSIPKIKGELRFENDRNPLAACIYCGTGRIVLSDINFVHQLQNLYFALCGEELVFSSIEK